MRLTPAATPDAGSAMQNDVICAGKTDPPQSR